MNSVITINICGIFLVIFFYLVLKHWKCTIYHHNELLITTFSYLIDFVLLWLFMAFFQCKILRWLFIFSWIVCSAATFDNIVKTLQQQMIDTPPSERDEAVLRSATKAFHAFSRALCTSLKNRIFICGDKWVLAQYFFGFITIYITICFSISRVLFLYFIPGVDIKIYIVY